MSVAEMKRLKERAISLISRFLKYGILNRHKKDAVVRISDTHGAENSSSGVQQRPSGVNFMVKAKSGEPLRVLSF